MCVDIERGEEREEREGGGGREREGEYVYIYRYVCVPFSDEYIVQGWGKRV